MRSQPGYKKRPGFITLDAGGVVEPVTGVAGYFKIVVGITVLAGADLGGIGRDIQNRFVVAQKALDPAGTVSDIQRQDFVFKTVVVVTTAIVQLANRVDPMALTYQLVAPTRRCALVSLGIGPAAVLVHVLPGGKRRPGRNTDRRRGVGLGKAGAPGCQLVEMGGFDQRMAGTAHRVMAMFIAKKDQYVGLVCHVEGSGDAVTPCLAKAEEFSLPARPDRGRRPPSPPHERSPGPCSWFPATPVRVPNRLRFRRRPECAVPRRR